MLVENREEARRFFVQVRQKFQNNQVLEPLEQLILDVILAHPEYDYILEKGETMLDQEFSPDQGEMNPFLHMSMHIAIKEQIQSDRPAGIRRVCEEILAKTGDTHEMEHSVMECLGESLWLAQRNNCLPDESAYLENLRALK
ncbi:MAG: DUF1841 family protein [Gammaproteobacteria bacterium]|nr:DUF1841 family protein [Gammaproteobacteria bacterium]